MANSKRRQPIEQTFLTRDLGNIVMTQQNFERVEIFAGGGTDNIAIGDLRGTDVREVVVDLAGVNLRIGETGWKQQQLLLENAVAQQPSSWRRAERSSPALISATSDSSDARSTPSSASSRSSRCLDTHDR